MAILVSLLYGGGGEVWKPEGNWYIRLATTLSIEVCIINSSCHRSLSLWRYVSDTLAATDICLYGSMCQIRWLPHATGLCLCGGMCQTCWLPQVSVSMEVCVLLYSVGWCHICSGL